MPSDMEILRKSIGELLNELTLSVEDFRVKILAQLESVPVSLPEVSQDSGESSPVVSTPSVRRTRSSKTSRASSADSTMCQPASAAPSDEISLQPTWMPPPWPMASPDQSEWFARLAGGQWVTPQGSLCDRAGWAVYSETWPLSGTMRSGSVCQRPPLVPRTSGTEPLSSPYYPPPVASLGEATEGRGAETTNHDTVRKLREMGVLPKREVFPTPMASGAGTSPETLEMVLAGESQMTLDRFVKLWPTPTASEGEGMKRILRSKETWGDTTSLAARIEGEVLGLTGKDKRESLSESSEVFPSSNGPSGQLNPTWVEWLMGFPSAWTDCDASVTPSSPLWPNGSGNASSTMLPTLTAADAKASANDGFSPLGRAVVRDNPRRMQYPTPVAGEARGSDVTVKNALDGKCQLNLSRHIAALESGIKKYMTNNEEQEGLFESTGD